MGQPEEDRQNRMAEWDMQNGTGRTVKAKWDRQNGASRTGQENRTGTTDRQNKTARTGQPERPEKDCQTGLPGQDCRRREQPKKDS